MKTYLKKMFFRVALGVCDLGLWVANRCKMEGGLEFADSALNPAFEGAVETLPPMPVSYPLSADARKGEVCSAVLQGGSLDGAVVEIGEGVRQVAMMLVENKTTGFVESYQRHDGRFVKRDGKLLGVYRWQLTVGKKKWGVMSDE